MPALEQKIFEAARGSKALLSLKTNPTHAERTKVSKSGNDLGDEGIGPKGAVRTPPSSRRKTAERITASPTKEVIPLQETARRGF